MRWSTHAAGCAASLCPNPRKIPLEILRDHILVDPLDRPFKGPVVHLPHERKANKIRRIVLKPAKQPRFKALRIVKMTLQKPKMLHLRLKHPLLRPK